MTQNFKKYTKDITNGYIYKKFIIFKNIHGILYRGSKLLSHMVFNLTMERPPRATL